MSTLNQQPVRLDQPALHVALECRLRIVDLEVGTANPRPASRTNE